LVWAVLINPFGSIGEREGLYAIVLNLGKRCCQEKCVKGRTVNSCFMFVTMVRFRVMIVSMCRDR